MSDGRIIVGVMLWSPGAEIRVYLYLNTVAVPADAEWVSLNPERAWLPSALTLRGDIEALVLLLHCKPRRLI